MKAVLCSQSVNRRRRLAELLVQLRRLRREQADSRQLLGRANAALDAAGEAAGFVRVSLRGTPQAGPACHLSIALDHAMLREAERRELVATTYVAPQPAMSTGGSHG